MYRRGIRDPLVLPYWMTGNQNVSRPRTRGRAYPRKNRKVGMYLRDSLDWGDWQHTVRDIHPISTIIKEIQSVSEKVVTAQHRFTSSGQSPIQRRNAQSTTMPATKKIQNAALKPCSRPVPQVCPSLTHKRSQTFAQDASAGFKRRAIDTMRPNEPVEAVHT